MKNNSRILTFILINILVSALTTLAVLWIWDLTHPLPEGSADQDYPEIDRIDPFQAPLNPTNTPESEGAAAIAFVDEDVEVVIHAIVGAGNLDVEYVEILNQSQGPVDMTGWKLLDAQGQSFSFPAMILNSNGAVKVLSKAGSNTVIELFWQAEAPIWESGEMATLRDAAGKTITTYSIP